MASKASKDDAYEVSDSTDWLQTPLAGLVPIEAALRCQVCKDFYTTPMVTSCMHTFCSLCIRRCLSNDGKCPACRAPDQELKLRNVWTLEDAVEAFKKSREGLLEHARKPAVAADRASPKRRLEDLSEGDGGYARKRTRSSSRRAAGPRENTIVIDSEDGDGDYVPGDDLVACPICNGRMTEKAVGEHIDQCTGIPPSSNRPPKKFSNTSLGSSSTTFNRPERLPHLNYSMFRDAALKKKLGDLGISSYGSRQLMEKRHTEWVTLWNANCDSKIPRKKSELRRELDIWERTQGAPAASSGTNSGNQLMNKDFDGAAWASNYEDSFKQLIANARRKPQVKAPSLPKSRSPPMTMMVERIAGEGPDPEIPETQTDVEDELNQQGDGNPPPILGSTTAKSTTPQHQSSMPIIEDRKGMVIGSELPTIRPL